MTQNNLGNALQSLGDREGDTARLQEAVTALDAALQVRTRDAAPMEWAGTQHNLAIAFLALHALDPVADWLDQAKTAFDNALTMRTRAAGQSYGPTVMAGLARSASRGSR